ncbi:TPA: KilA-N domain-containing protein [Neisseria meningitidis]|uniref:KilA-N domain n=2 Tax=Neisseria meningitidis TaxID=487 RepID=A0AB33U005_NEIME|nr:KilA-N domain-containing protein [Neisseria meningitidis]CWN40789.1 KilA-N domain [Neisseria meningitidis]CWP72299.1 KilA-N domain [Neisseria meningitidis]CWR38324.1 KilA-N domain [Neisseria meningitidis]CWT41548.1 KilA-N domain [Neisseria meningitidis]
MGNEIINVQGVEVKITDIGGQDYICITDMCRAKDGDFFISDWLRNRNTIEFLGIWEGINNPVFNYGEFATIKNQAGLNSYKISVKDWAQKTGAIGLVAKAGRYGGTYAHKDIAFEFGMWISPEFKLYLIKEFQRLKEAESRSAKAEWDIRRTLAKAQYRIHTDAIKNNLIPAEINGRQAGVIYATEADILNKALFGCTAKEWKAANPDKAGNIRDYASIEQLVVLASLESQNALLIELGQTQQQRLVTLNQQARRQIQSILNSRSIQQPDSPLLDK